MTFSTNHPILFALAGIIIAVVLAQSVFFLIKAWKRGAEIGMDTLNAKPDPEDRAPIWERLRRVDDKRLFTVFEALKNGISVAEINSITRIDKWFLSKLKKLADAASSMQVGPLASRSAKEVRELASAMVIEETQESR